MTPTEIIALHWICECGESAEDIEENAAHVVSELTKAGYTIVRPVTAEEEAANFW